MSEQQLERWRVYAHRSATLTADDVAELEEHLRGQMADLVASGLSDDEAFLIAVKRMGGIDDVSREFAREHSDRLWKQLVLTGDDPAEARGWGRDLGAAIALGVGAALSVRAGTAWLDEELFVRLVSVLVLPWVAAYFVWKRALSARQTAALGAGFAAVATLLAIYPFDGWGSDTLLLAAIHAPILLWLLTGVAYAGGDWRSGRRRMDFVRFTGEYAVYYFLLAAGGGLLLALTIGTFSAIDVDVEVVVAGWVLPMGAAGAALIAAWLVESKQNVIENIAPVLARVFSPLTIVLLGSLLVAFAVDPGVIDVERDLLILMSVILVLVVALSLYALSARPPQAPPGLADWLQVVLMVAAVVVDLVVLVAMAGRIAELGATPNRTVALGLNVILLVNLAVSAWLSLSFVRGRCGVAALERWQTSYLTVYAAWAAVVVVAWGPMFSWA